MKTENKIYSKTVKPKVHQASPIDIDEAERKQTRIKATLERREKLIDTADKLSGNRLFFRNWMYPNAKETFPNSPELWYVNRYYTMADGGPLAIDEPETDWDRKLSEMKRPALKAAGIRFYVIDRKKTLEEMVFDVECLKVEAKK